MLDGYVYNRADWEEAENDAYLLLRLYRKYGFEEALKRVNGDFAIALFDEEKDILWLARDRFGLKPLYYTTKAAAGFAFASRPRALMALEGVSREINKQFAALFAAAHYRYFDNRPNESPYADIAQLPAAHYLRVHNGYIQKRRYWALSEQPDLKDADEQLAEHYRELLSDAVGLRLAAANHRPAFTLSGGMDSSSVLASAVRVSGEKQHAFSTVYADKTYDESDEIRSMLATKVEEWHPVSVDAPDVMRLVDQMVQVHDEPVATATWLSHYVLCQEVSSQGFGGLFGGLGGDELNAGEYEYFLYHFADLHHGEKNNRQFDHEVDKWVEYHDHPIFRKNMQVVHDGFSRLLDINKPGRCLPDPIRLERYAPALNDEFFNLVTFEPILDHPFTSYLKNRTYQDIYRETAPCCLRAEDRQATAFNLENFLPFFDHRLAEFMFRVPGRLKIREGVTKRLLRDAMQGVLPEETRSRIKKTGWNAPAHIWFTGEGGEHLRDLVSSQAFKERGVYNVKYVEHLIDEHDDIMKSGRLAENHMMFFWQLVNLESWLRYNQSEMVA